MILTDKNLGRAINRLRFKTHVWGKAQEEFCDYDRAFIMVNDVRILCGQEKMTRKFFNEGIQYRHIFQGDYQNSMEEFRRLCAGDW